MRLLFIFVFFTGFAFGQISVSELIKVAKMDRQIFEIYAKKNGFKTYDNIIDTEVNQLIMSKENFEHFLAHASKYYSDKYNSNFQTTNFKILSSLHEELSDLGFELTEEIKTKEMLEHYQSTNAEIFIKKFDSKIYYEEIGVFIKKNGYLEIAYSMRRYN